jgi:thiosulfate/3-mercaptopyruvate sulfurtransferase
MHRLSVEKHAEIEFMNDKILNYAHPEALVDTGWLQGHLDDPSIRIVESNEDLLLYDTGHIPGAVHIDWRRDLQDQLVRDYIREDAFAKLCATNGIGPETTVVIYGDKSNWWACYAFWVFSLFGHKQLKVLDGGRDFWIDQGGALDKVVPSPGPCDYPIPSKRRDDEIRAFYPEALAHSQANRPLVDVRSPGEFSGAVTHMPDYPQEGVLRGGHIPGATSCPWKRAANDDATFLPIEELRAIYADELQLKQDDEIVAYCRIGERSSHTWFVLTYLLGYKNVRNYDGSWTEWGNMVGAPIERAGT